MERSIRKRQLYRLQTEASSSLIPCLPSHHRDDFEFGVSILKVRNLIMRYAICNRTSLLPLNPQMETNGCGVVTYSLPSEIRRGGDDAFLLHIANLIMRNSSHSESHSDLIMRFAMCNKTNGQDLKIHFFGYWIPLLSQLTPTISYITALALRSLLRNG
jgi:hypothetical protein